MNDSKLKPPIFVIITIVLIVLVGAIIFISSEIGLLSGLFHNYDDVCNISHIVQKRLIVCKIMIVA